MAYTINKTNGDLFATVPNGTVNTDSSLIMIGKNYAGYGEALNENFFKLLENHANSTAPSSPQPGQLWYDSSTTILKVWNNNEWKDLGSSAAGETGPAEPIAGDLWFDTVNSQLNVYDGSTYVLIGPSYSSGTGTTGSIVETVTDGSIDYVIIKVVVSDATVAIISKHVEFTPTPLIAGFTSIKPGYNLSTNVDGQVPVFSGTATNAELLDGIDSTGFLSAVGNDSTSGTLAIENDGGLDIGVDGDMELSVSGTDTILNNTNATGDILIQSAGTSVITVDGTSNRARVETPLAGTDIANVDFVEAATVASASALESATTTVEVSASTAPTAGQVLRATSSTSASWQTVSTNGETPIGGIIMYSGALAAIPVNWSICDGTSGTPNLVDKFVYGTATEGEIGDTGGTADAVNVSHSHTFSGNALPGHSHTQDGGQYSGGSSAAGGDIGINQWTNANGTTSSVSAGTPSGSISTSGVSGVGQNIPPYVKLAYIMRIS